MTSISHFKNKISILFTDIDDTITSDGKLPAESFQALWELFEYGINVVPVTGRPAGWCEMIARFWPVKGVIGENGAFYFSYQNNQMKRVFSKTIEEQKQDAKKLEQIKIDILSEVPNAGISSDQFCRLFDLAIDFCEDVPPLSEKEINKITDIFKMHGATCKVSSIHVNGWFGDFNKLKMSLKFLENEFHLTESSLIQKCCAFVGDSPNDEPMFEYFENSIAVANIQNFISKLKFQPKFVANLPGGLGFQEIARQLMNKEQGYKKT